MKKNMLIGVVVIIAVLLVFNYLNTGKITLIPSFGLSEEERDIKMLEEELRDIERSFVQAGRASAISGVDATADAEAAMRMVKHVESKAKELKRNASSEEIKNKIERLEDKIRELKNKLEI